jgi:hypothetical protein
MGWGWGRRRPGEEVSLVCLLSPESLSTFQCVILVQRVPAVPLTSVPWTVSALGLFRLELEESPRSCVPSLSQLSCRWGQCLPIRLTQGLKIMSAWVLALARSTQL